MIDQIASAAGDFIGEKIFSSKKSNVFTRTIDAVKLLMMDPEKADAHIYVEKGEIIAEITPNREKLQKEKKARQIMLKISTRDVVVASSDLEKK